MFKTDFGFDPYKFAAANLALWADITKATQKRMVDAAANAAETMPGMMNWEPGKMPTLNTKFDFSENKMREAFQSAADANLNAWSHTATMLAAMPDWVHLPTQLPGRAMTDMFDHFKAPPKHRGNK